MKLERLLQVNVAALTVVGALLLGVGQDNPMLPALALFAAVTSIYFTDVTGWFRLHRAIANLAAVGALFISLREFDIWGGDSTSQLGAIASLLVYLQFVLLYQEKNQRVYWQLIVLSLLQVVVAAALQLGPEFGLLLVGYMFAALSAMSLLLVYQHVEAVREEQDAASETRPLLSTSSASSAGWARMAVPQAVRQCSDAEIVRTLLGRGFLWRLLAIGSATLVLAVVIFYATPRMGDDVWRGARRGGARTVGFSGEIRLGNMAPILQSDQRALRVQFLDRQGRPLVLEDPPYLRGGSLTVYQFHGGEGQWSQGDERPPWRMQPLPAVPENADWIETRLVLESASSPLLFSVAPAWRTENTQESVRYDLVDEQVVSSNWNPLQGRFSEVGYTVATTGIQDGRQPPVWPRRDPQGMPGGDKLPGGRFGREMRFLTTGLPGASGVSRTARQVLQEAGFAQGRFAPDQVYEAAKALESHFHQPGLYTYTLDQSALPPPLPGVDPIEHFVVNHRSGHCEYFASALVMMLRSQGVPARVVVGYRGGEFNPYGRFYEVRQADAHAWVEAHLELDQVPRSLRRHLSADAVGAWLRLDPTPAAPREAPDDDMLARASQAASFLEAVWNDHVLGLNSSRQKEAIYEPLLRRVRAMYDQAEKNVRAMNQAATWKFFFRDFINWFGMDEPGARFPWRTLLLLALLGVSLALLLRLAWRWSRERGYVRQMERWFAQRRRASPSPEGASVAFFRRFEKMLARRRLRRQAHQTQREFAAHAAGELAPVLARSQGAAVLDRMVEAYYRVRFGGRPLDVQEAEAIERALDQLEQDLAKRNS